MRRWIYGALGCSATSCWWEIRPLRAPPIMRPTDASSRWEGHTLGIHAGASQWGLVGLRSPGHTQRLSAKIPNSALNGPRKLTILPFLLWPHQVDVRFPPSMPLGAQDLISKLLRYQPSERLPLVQILEHPWVRAHSRRVLPPSAQMVS